MTDLPSIENSRRGETGEDFSEPPVLDDRSSVWIVLAVGIWCLLLTALVAHFYRPVPLCHDEFSYLLAADTFSRGRVTNPTHPLWEHFESFHVLHHPSYMSKYPPAQGLFLAAGQAIFGDPLYGVWLSASLAAGAFAWMLIGLVPKPWALFGGLLIASHPILFLYWGQNYWGGAVAMAGGCLVFGAIRRIHQRTDWKDGFMLAMGLALLANSRPFEGLVVSLPCALLLFRHFWKASSDERSAIWRNFIWPVTGLLLVVAGMMGYYNHRITGHALTMPYVVHENAYAVVPLFLWQDLRPEPDYRHAVIQRFFTVDAIEQHWTPMQTGSGWARRKLLDAISMGRLFFTWPLLIPLLAIGQLRASRWSPFALLTAGLTFLVSLATTWMIPHYFAPALGLVFLLIVSGMIYLAGLGRFGQIAVVALLAIHLKIVFADAAAYIAGSQHTPPDAHWSQVWAWQREQIRKRLLEEPGDDLVVVRYGPQHAASPAEWVYNAADIDASPIVWAREMDSERNRKLLEYYQDRRVWLLLPDEEPPKLIEHKPAGINPSGSDSRLPQ